MKATKLLPYFVIAGLILIIFLQRECTKCPEQKLIPPPKDSTITKIEYKDRLIKKTVYLPKPYKVIDSIFLHDTIFRTHADTVKAMQDYSTYKKYDLSLINDSSGKVNCLVDVQFNQIAKYQLKGTLFDRTKVIEHNHYVMEEKHNKLFAGAQIGYSIPDTSLLIKPTLHFLTKKDNAYQVSYEPFRQIVEFGLLWKIRLKK